MCVAPATALLHASDGLIFYAAQRCIFGASDIAEARGIGRAVPCDTLRLSCPTPLLSKLLWPPLSQQQRLSLAVLIAPTPHPPSPSPCVIMVKHNVYFRFQPPPSLEHSLTNEFQIFDGFYTLVISVIEHWGRGRRQRGYVMLTPAFAISCSSATNAELQILAALNIRWLVEPWRHAFSVDVNPRK